MRITKKLDRIVKFIDEMKREHYPNAVSFSKVLSEAALTERSAIYASPKTVQRDIDHLRGRLGAPVEYCPIRRGYYLSNPNWVLPNLCLSQDELFATLFSTRVSQPFLPAPIQQDLEGAKDVELAATAPGNLNLATLDSIVVATGATVPLPTHTSRAILQAWQETRRLDITYIRGADEEVTERQIDIHVLFLSAGAWYARAYCHLRQQMRSFALHRITTATLCQERFERSTAVVDEVSRGIVFDYDVFRDIRLTVAACRATYFRERTWFPGQQIEKNADGTLTVSYPAAAEPLFLQWVLSFMGAVTVLAPAEARQKTGECAALLAQAHG